MTRVSAPTRLHFGLIHVPTASSASRRFGGCGVMLAAPRVELSVTRAESWSATGSESARALEFARRVAEGLGIDEPLRIAVESCPPGHTGLGVGTALGLAVARGIAHLIGRGGLGAEELANLAGRGERSAIGARGAGVGGFLVDGGLGKNMRLGPAIIRFAFPEWPIVLARPRATPSWHGTAERAAFARERDPSSVERNTGHMCQMLLLGMLPALAEHDYSAFAHALFDYNRAAGEAFAEDQGGVYASRAIENLIGVARQSGGLAAGQSSWGPTLFAICPDSSVAKSVARAITDADPLANIVVTAADNFGATLR